MNKIAYITVNAPFGRLGETYILPEMLALQKIGIDLLVVTRDHSKELYHEIALPLTKLTISMPRFSGMIAKELIKYIIKCPVSFMQLLKKTVLSARSFSIAIKNLVVLPKGIYISEALKKNEIKHIHAHYGSTTSTIAYIVSEITGIPWSFTLHRWDIPENNILKNKCKAASFVRVIDEQGRREVIEIIDDVSLNDKISVIHVGVNVPAINDKDKSGSGKFVILCPAMFVPKKGHEYLIKACRILSERGVAFSCLLAGDGELKEEFIKMISKANLDDNIRLLGPLPQEKIFGLYKSDLIDTVVLPSIEAENGEKEGIPVSLMEAMAYKIPVISTNTGGIGELIGDGSGIMIEEKDPAAIADSIEKLINDKYYYKLVSELGREKIENEFNVRIISKDLLDLFSLNSNN